MTICNEKNTVQHLLFLINSHVIHLVLAGEGRFRWITTVVATYCQVQQNVMWLHKRVKMAVVAVHQFGQWLPIPNRKN